MQKKSNFRSGRLAHEIKRVLSEFLLMDSSSEYVGIESKNILITDVVVSPDLRYAKIFISNIGNANGSAMYIEFLKNNHGRLRHHIAQEIPLRYVPDLAFHEDRSGEYAENIEHLLKIAAERTGDISKG